MSLILRLSQIYIPGFVKKMALVELFECTAEAFRCIIPKIDYLSLDELLLKYAQFTRDQSQTAIRRGDDLQELKKRLYRNAYQLGQKYKKRFHIRNIKDAMATSRVIYRVIGIDFQGNTQGKIIISRCFFSKIYSSEVCKIISGLDEGILAGLSGGGKLNFSHRITDGERFCRACFTK
jgi:hypothetical protein